MTNGEAFRKMFPDIEVKEHVDGFGYRNDIDGFGYRNGIDVFIFYTKHQGFKLWFPTSWWNAKYEGVSNDKSV